MKKVMEVVNNVLGDLDSLGRASYQIKRVLEYFAISQVLCLSSIMVSLTQEEYSYSWNFSQEYPYEIKKS